MDVDGEVEVEADLTTSSSTTVLTTTTTTSGSHSSIPVRVILPTSYQFVISQEDVNRLLEMRRVFYQKENERKLSKLGLPVLVDHDGLLSTTTSTIDDSANSNAVSSSAGKLIRRRDMEWLSIVLPFVKKYNPHCGVCASSKNYGRRLDTANSYLLRSYFYCQGRDCPFNCTVTIKENGKALLCSRFSNGNIVDHRNAKRVARPNRSLNKSNMSNTSNNNKNNNNEMCPDNSTKRYRKSPNSNPISNQWNPTFTDELTANFNTSDLNLTDADFEETLRLSSTKRFINMCCNLVQLTTNLRQEIDPTGLLPGALQHVSLSPFHIAVHTENSLRYYHSMLTKKTLDKPPPLLYIKPTATSIQQNNTINTASQIIILNNDIIYHPARTNSSLTTPTRITASTCIPQHHITYMFIDSIEHDDKKLFYCEFMLSNIDDSSFIPISFSYTENTDDTVAQNYVLKSWLERFRFDHEHLYKSSFPSLSKNYFFPQPLLILVDNHRETPLNNCCLQFFNNETFKQYIMRTYLLVSSKIEYPVQQESTNRIVLYVSSSLIAYDFRTLVNKYVSNELRQLALWSSLLLLYTQTWREVRQNWSLICEIFLNWGTNFVSLKAYEELCAKVAKIENDPDITHLMDLIYNSANTINHDEQQDEQDNDDNNEDKINDGAVDLSDFQNDHFYTKNMITNETNRYVSPYENDLRRIFNEKNKSKTALISSWDTLSISDRTILRKIKGNWKWLHLLLKDYIPSMPLWSNLIHSISNNVKHVRLNKRITRLMISKDKRINQIKRIQLAERVHRKTDLVISSLAKDLHSQVANADLKH
ncbi:unnamed protein product [Rotaria magnacalcarata]|uniref:Uncharacterized protein n=1 Tax=Rotaria magnacalcarata TaxID=392030 RepID=A0A816M427_9BILA|nr:unnamed protein product [Rotaria magnacalcarata]